MLLDDVKVKPLIVVIVGAGVAGLATAYGLTRPDVCERFDVRVLEKRTKEQTLEAGYPIHLSPSGRDAIAALLTPADQHLLYLAKQSLPARHDGISFFNSDCKRIWHTLREPFESNLVERGDLLRILRDQVAGSLEFGRRIVAVKNRDQGPAVMLSDGEIIYADLLIGADGMFSPIRKALHPVDQFHPMPWITCNFRLSPTVLASADPRGINVFYGTGWSAAVMPTADGVYAALTVSAPIHDIASALAFLPDSPILNAIRADPGSKIGRAFPLYSATTTQVGRGKVVLIGDASHGQNPFCGAGASMAMNDASNLVKLLKSTDDLITFHKNLKKTADPMIKLSKTLLWLAQGKTPVDRSIRGVAFRTIETVEKVSPHRRRLRKKLEKVLHEEEAGKCGSKAPFVFQ